jgi:hypothetical protein
VLELAAVCQHLDCITTHALLEMKSTVRRALFVVCLVVGASKHSFRLWWGRGQKSSLTIAALPLRKFYVKFLHPLHIIETQTGLRGSVD